MNYNHSRPHIPPPPALPRFELPNEGSEEAVDPSEVAATAQRPALHAARARRVVRRTGAAPALRADATSEVQVEDILLEVYTEDPPPPTRRSVEAPQLYEVAAAHASHTGSLLRSPPDPLQNADVDALLRASGAAFLPFGGYAEAPRPPTPPHAFTQQPQQPQQPQWAPVDHDSPSVAPVAFPSMHMQLSAEAMAPVAGSRSGHAPARASAVRARPGRRGASVALWTVMLLVVGVAVGGGAALAVRNPTYARETYARLRDGAKAVAARAGSKSSPAAAQPAAAEPAAVFTPAAPSAPSAEAPAAVAVPAAATPPSVPVSSLPQLTIAADSSLVTFPAAAQGHRVFFDGRPIAVTTAPMKLRCGRHMIRIGSTGKARITDLACGREVTLLK